MEISKKVKITAGFFYLIVVSSFIYFFLTKFTLEELTSYEFIKNNREYFFNLKKVNLIFLSFVFVIVTIVWVFIGGFGIPVALLAGFIFGKWLGTAVVVFGLSIGATFLYIFANYFLKDLIKEKFLYKFKNLELKFKKSEFNYLLLYRFVGGLPFALSNILPCIFNVKVKNFFFATMLGIIPGLFLIVSLGSGLEKIIVQNLNAPNIIDLLFSPEIYTPILLFIGLIIITIITRKIFFKD